MRSVVIRGREYELNPAFDWEAESALVEAAHERLARARHAGRAAFRLERRRVNGLMTDALARMTGARRGTFKGRVWPEDQESMESLLRLLLEEGHE
jgi:hypothetical protein